MNGASTTRAVPTFAIRDRSEVPPENQNQRWAKVDWDGVRAALADGKAVTFNMAKGSVAVARTHAYSRLGRGIRTRYLEDLREFWIYRHRQ